MRSGNTRYMLKHLSLPVEVPSPSISDTTLTPSTVADEHRLPSLVGGAQSLYERLLHHQRTRSTRRATQGVHAGGVRSTSARATKWSARMLANNPGLDAIRSTSGKVFPMAYATLKVDWLALGQLYDYMFQNKPPTDKNAVQTLGEMLKRNKPLTSSWWDRAKHPVDQTLTGASNHLLIVVSPAGWSHVPTTWAERNTLEVYHTALI